MRLWSVHPKYLDDRGLVACWREGLLAKSVLLDNTKGYRNHPQLYRFKEFPDSILAIDAFLSRIYDESATRGYVFDVRKIAYNDLTSIIPVNSGQINYEFKHLSLKLASRNKEKLRSLNGISDILPNLIFFIRDGNIEKWERIA